MLIGNKNFDLKNSAYVCGILNVTPDSFSDGGRYNNIEGAEILTDSATRDDKRRCRCDRYRWGIHTSGLHDDI